MRGQEPERLPFRRELGRVIAPHEGSGVAFRDAFQAALDL